MTFTCDDSPLGHRELHPAADRRRPRAQNQPVTGTAVDNAGNTASDPATVSIDKTEADRSRRRPDRPPQRQRLVRRRRHRDLHVRRRALGHRQSCSAARDLRAKAPTRPPPGRPPTRPATPTAATRRPTSTSTRPRRRIDGAPTTAPERRRLVPRRRHRSTGPAATPSPGVDGLCPADTHDHRRGRRPRRPPRRSATGPATRRVGDAARGSTSTARRRDHLGCAPTRLAEHRRARSTLTATDDLSGVDGHVLLGGRRRRAVRHERGGRRPRACTRSSSGASTYAGNTETAAVVDRAHRQVQRPTISHTQSPVPNAAGWNNTSGQRALQLCRPARAVGRRELLVEPDHT